MSLGTLTIDLAANVATLQSDLGKAQRLFDANARKFEATVAKTLTVASGLGVAAAAGIALVTQNAISLADSFDELSPRVNVSVEDLSAYAYQAKFAGVSQEELSGALIKFGKVSADAFNGVGKGVDAFDALDISVRNSDGSMKSISQLMQEVAGRFSEFEDGPQKAALAMDLFGKSAGPALMPMLNQGIEGMRKSREEAERFNQIISSESAAAAGQFNDNLDKLRAVASGLGNVLAEKSLPAMNGLVNIVTDETNQRALGVFADGVFEIGERAIAAATNAIPFVKVISFLKGIEFKPDWFDKDEIDSQEKSLARLIERAKMLYGDDFISDERFKWDPISDDIAQATIELEKLKKIKEMETSSGEAKAKNKNQFSSEIDAEYKERIKIIEAGMAAELDAALKIENELIAANQREVLSQRDKFARIHEERLAAEEKVVDLENFRFERDRQMLDRELEAIREKGLLTAELQAEFERAAEDRKAAHVARLKQIEERAAEEERKKKEEGYRNLIGLAETYNNAKGQAANRYTAVALNALRIVSSKERMESIKTVTRDGFTAVQKAWASAAFPSNIPAVTLAGAAAAANLASVTGIAHGGLDYVPKESTYLLDKGERVLSPNQNKDLVNFMANGGVATVNVFNYGNEKVSVNQADGTIDIVVGKAVEKLNDQILRGNGVATTMQRVYGLQRRGS